MNQKHAVSITDYHAGAELLEDPTDPNETVEREFMNRLGKLITHAEEMSQHGAGEIDANEFLLRRGDFLDLLGEHDIASWLEKMRAEQRVPFRRYPVRG